MRVEFPTAADLDKKIAESERYGLDSDRDVNEAIREQILKEMDRRQRKMKIFFGKHLFVDYPQRLRVMTVVANELVRNGFQCSVKERDDANGWLGCDVHITVPMY